MKTYSRNLIVISAILAVFATNVQAADLLVAGPTTIKRYDGSTGAFLGDFVLPGPFNAHGLLFGLDGDLYVNDTNSDSVQRYNGQTGTYINDFVAAPSGGPRNGELLAPFGEAFGVEGHLYVVNNLTHNVKRFDGATGEFIDVFVASQSGGLDEPLSMIFGPDGDLYVGSNTTDSVKRYNGTTGAFIDDFVTPGDGGLLAPIAMVFGPDGNLYVSDLGTDSIKRYNGGTGDYIDDFVFPGSGGMNNPFGLIFGEDGNLYVANQILNSVKRYNGITGAFIDDFVMAGSGGLVGPQFLIFREPPPAIFSCIDLEGNHVVGSTVKLHQNKGPTQTTTTNAAGCFAFDEYTAHKKGKIIIKLPGSE